MKLILSLLFTTWVLFGFSQIFDHRHIYPENIPVEYIDSVKQNCRLQWVGQSHGHQITTGIKLAELDNPLLDATVDICLPETGPFRVMDGFVPDWTPCGCISNWGGPSNYWLPPDGPIATDKAMNCHDINVSGWTWCTELYSSTYDLQAYFNQMQIFEDTYPWVQFIYSTATTEYDGEEGYNRWNNNNLIRQHCLDNDKILFDFADIECWYEGEFSYYIYTTGDTIPTRHSAYPDEDYHHTNYLNCANKGRVIWSMMAYLQGWNSDPCAKFNHELWSEQVGLSGINMEADCNADNQVDNQDKSVFYNDGN